LGADQGGFRTRAVRSLIFFSRRRVCSLVNITKEKNVPREIKKENEGGKLCPKKRKKKRAKNCHKKERKK
jgi:hypothetical protein